MEAAAKAVVVVKAEEVVAVVAKVEEAVVEVVNRVEEEVNNKEVPSGNQVIFKR